MLGNFGMLLGPASELQQWLDEASGDKTLSTYAIEIAHETKEKYGHKVCNAYYAMCYGAPCTCPWGDCFGEEHEWKDGDGMSTGNNTAECDCWKRMGEFDSVNLHGKTACTDKDGGIVPGVPKGYRP